MDEAFGWGLGGQEDGNRDSYPNQKGRPKHHKLTVQSSTEDLLGMVLPSKKDTADKSHLNECSITE